MINWLQIFTGSKSSGINMESEELLSLRKELKRLKSKHENDEDDEMILKTESDEANDDGENQDKIDEMIEKKAKQNQNNMRSSVSAEVYGQFYSKGDFKPKVVPKSDDQKTRIQEIVQKSFIFNSLEENDLNTVLDAMDEAKYNSGDNVIIQGERGEVLYVVEKGDLDCFKVFKKGESPVMVRQYLPGDAFGELALLYNAPRAATITAKTDCTLWSLDRETFNHIVKDAAIKKREKYQSFLKSIEILDQIEPYELTQICDALKLVAFEAEDEIIQEVKFIY
jgi:cAMP-dependent protein kinase regulator